MELSPTGQEREGAGQTTTTSDNIILDERTIYTLACQFAWPFLLFSVQFCTKELSMYPNRCYSAMSPMLASGKIQT